MLFSEPKIPQSPEAYRDLAKLREVSVLFSEPKISQLQQKPRIFVHQIAARFSALQRAENSSIGPGGRRSAAAHRRFQCSSASRKFLNSPRRSPARREDLYQCSSASRKFHNLVGSARAYGTSNEFQCSSASRKFLNASHSSSACTASRFQCSSASRKFLN